MPAYRLELWFDYNNKTLDWGMAVANPGGPPPFANGGTAITPTLYTDPKGKKRKKVSFPGENSTIDVYVFDVTSPPNVVRVLDFIQVDFEKANPGQPGQGNNNNPAPDAPAIRQGLPGLDFNGAANGGANGTTLGTGQENTIYSSPTPLTAQRRWSGQDGYETLTPGNYTFTVVIRVTDPSNGQIQLNIDPEMDIS